MSVVMENKTLTTQVVVTTDNSESVKCEEADRVCHQLTITDDTPAAVGFDSATEIANATNTFTDTATDLSTGVKGQFTTSSALPTGLSLATDYFVYKVDANTVKFATSLALALAGTPDVTISDDGTGTQTFTPTALAGGSVQLQGTNDNVSDSSITPVWVDIGAATNVTADVNLMLEDDDVGYLYSRVQAVVTAGRLNIVNKVVTKKISR